MGESLITTSEGFFYLKETENKTKEETKLFIFENNPKFPDLIIQKLEKQKLEEIYNIKTHKKYHSIPFYLHEQIRDTPEYEELESVYSFKNLMMLNIMQILDKHNYSDYFHKTHHFPTFLYYHGALKKISNESVENKHTLTRKLQSDMSNKGSRGKNKEFLKDFNPCFLRNEKILELFYSRKVIRLKLMMDDISNSKIGDFLTFGQYFYKQKKLFPSVEITPNYLKNANIFSSFLQEKILTFNEKL